MWNRDVICLTFCDYHCVMIWNVTQMFSDCFHTEGWGLCSLLLNLGSVTDYQENIVEVILCQFLGPIEEVDSFFLLLGCSWLKPNYQVLLLLLLLSHFSRVWLCATPETAAHQALPSLGFSRQEHWSGLPFPPPMHESEKWKWSCSVVSDSSRPHGLQPTRLLRPWDFPGKSTGVGCHCLLPPSLKEAQTSCGKTHHGKKLSSLVSIPC